MKPNDTAKCMVTIKTCTVNDWTYRDREGVKDAHRAALRWLLPVIKRS